HSHALHPFPTRRSSDLTTPPSVGGHLLVAKGGPGGKVSRRARKFANTASGYASSGDEAFTKKGKAGKAGTVKKGRKWGPDGLVEDRKSTRLNSSHVEIS